MSRDSGSLAAILARIWERLPTRAAWLARTLRAWTRFGFSRRFSHNRLFLRAGQFAGLDFYGNQEYGASYLIEPLDYAFGNLFSTTCESFNPAGTPAAEIQVIPWRTL
jgi:hypothetical protein